MSSISFIRSNNIENIYSNTPEEIISSEPKYTVEKALTPSKYYIFEYYHKWCLQSTGIVAIVAKNTNNGSGNITIIGGNSRVATGATNRDPATYACAQNYLDYINGLNSSVITLEPGETKILGACSNLTFGMFATGKYSFFTNSSGIIVRVVYGLNSTSLNSWFNVNTPTIPTSGSYERFRFSGTVGYNSLSASININTNSNFIICEHNHFESWPTENQIINSNEYCASQSYLTGGCNFLAGNFGVLYNLNIANCNNKVLKIYPPCNAPGESGADDWFSNICIFVNGAWQELRFKSLTSDTAVTQTIVLNNAISQTIKVYHPGGNSSNYVFKFT